MALPIPQVPTYKTTLPISGQVVTYRTFLVKESKIIQLAMTSDDMAEILGAIKQVIGLCTLGTVNVNKLSMVDLNWLMVKVRSVSNGDSVDLAMKCKNNTPDGICGYVNEMAVSLKDMKVSGEMPDTKVPLYADVGVVMIPPSVELLSILSQGDTPGEQIMKVVMASIDFIYEGEVIHTSEDTTQEQVVDFLDNLTAAQLEPLTDFIKNQPKLSVLVDYKCGGCGVEHKIEVDNITDFLD